MRICTGELVPKAYESVVQQEVEVSKRMCYKSEHERNLEYWYVQGHQALTFIISDGKVGMIVLHERIVRM